MNKGVHIQSGGDHVEKEAPEAAHRQNDEAFLTKPEIYADLLNFYLYGGQEVIKGSDLHDVDRLLMVCLAMHILQSA